MSNIDELARIKVFQGVSRSDLRSLLAAASTTRFAEGAVVLREGDPADTALLVLSGRLRASVRAGHQVRQLGGIRPGEVVGEQALFVGASRRNATVTALAPTRCLLISRELLHENATNAGIVAIEKHLLRVMSRRVRRSHKAIREAWHDTQRDEDRGKRGPTLRERLRGLFREAR